MTKEPSNSRGNRIPLFLLVTGLYWFSMYTYVPVFAVYLESLGISAGMSGMIIGSYGFVQMLLRIPVGVMSEKFKKKRVFISFGLFFSFFSAIGLLFSGEPIWILIFRGLAGAAAATWVDFTVLYVSYFDHGHATKAIGTLNFYNSLGQMSGVLLGGVLAESLGYGSTFLTGALVATAAFCLSFFIKEHKTESEKTLTYKGVVQVAKDRTLLTVSFLAILSQIITFATVFGFTPKYAQMIGASKLDMAILTIAASLPNAIAAILGGGQLKQKMGAKAVVTWGFLINALFTLIIPFVSNFWILIVTQAIAGFGRGMSFSLLMGLSIQKMPNEKRPVAMGFFQAIYGLGMFVGPAIMGFAGEYNFSQGFIIIGCIGLLSTVLAQITINNNI